MVVMLWVFTVSDCAIVVLFTRRYGGREKVGLDFSYIMDGTALVLEG